MSLLNLKKSKPLAKPHLRSVEDFIDDALLYAQGKVDNNKKTGTKNENKKDHRDCHPATRAPGKTQGMRHATFTLTPQCIEKLANIAQKTGKTKSALIRVWINENGKM